MYNGTEYQGYYDGYGNGTGEDQNQQQQPRPHQLSQQHQQNGHLAQQQDLQNAHLSSQHQLDSQQQQQQLEQFHAVRLQIPQYMQAAPMLAPGGGGEVLPAGLLNSAGAHPPWYANSGLVPGSEYSPISIQHTPTQESTPQTQTTTGQSPFDYDADPQSSAAGDPPPVELHPETGMVPSAASKALNLCISQGFINPAKPITPSQLTAIGINSSASPTTAGLNAPSSLGLPVYSASGFDLLSVMARVATRPEPKVVLGPVDLTSSFVVVDVRRHDCPVIYVSPTFCRLTGYDETEVIGRNCRFLQSPNGEQARGQVRQYTSHEAVKHLKKNLVADKECQTSIINYKKNGDAFINLVTVIPIRGGELGASGDEDKVVYHVGFQVDLTEQPNAILQKLKDGTYIVNYTANNPVAVKPINPLNRLFQQQQHHRGLGGIGAGSVALGLGIGGGMAAGVGGLVGVGGYGLGMSAKDRKLNAIGVPVVSPEMKKYLEEPEFLKSFPVTTGVNADAVPPPTSANDNEESGNGSGTPPPPGSPTPTSPTLVGTPQSTQSGSQSQSGLIIPSPTPHSMAGSTNHLLSLILLEYTPDFLHVVSLKGDFLYVAPSVRRVLGYESHELVGRSLVDICHPSDKVPLMRELKESSSVNLSAGAPGAGASTGEDGEDVIPSSASNPASDILLMRPRTVDLLFRAQTKGRRYVWVECRGRLYQEPGKGRKAILLSGRAKEMAGLKWETVKSASGGVRGTEVGVRSATESPKEVGKDTNGRKRKKAGAEESPAQSPPDKTPEQVDIKSEFWGTITRSGIMLVVTSGVRDVLGYEETDLMGRHVDMITDDKVFLEEVAKVGGTGGMSGVRRTTCRMFRKGYEVGPEEEATVEVEVILYPASVDDTVHNSEQTISPTNVIYQIRRRAGGTEPDVMHPTDEDVFLPLDTNRGSSWQYELQQLRFANDRLKEQIKELEGEMDRKASISSASGPLGGTGLSVVGNAAARRFSAPASSSILGGAENQERASYMHSNPSSWTGDTGNGNESASTSVSASSTGSAFPGVAVYDHQPQPSYEPQASAPWAYQSVPVPVPVSMGLSIPARYQNPNATAQQHMRYQQPFQPPTPSSLKRGWGGGAPGGGGGT